MRRTDSRMARHHSEMHVAIDKVIASFPKDMQEEFGEDFLDGVEVTLMFSCHGMTLVESAGNF